MINICQEIAELTSRNTKVVTLYPVSMFTKFPEKEKPQFTTFRCLDLLGLSPVIITHKVVNNALTFLL